ncbi:MAG: hypothetical protein ABL998_23870 [Planctomycetota bacterium]
MGLEQRRSSGGVRQQREHDGQRRRGLGGAAFERRGETREHEQEERGAERRQREQEPWIGPVFGSRELPALRQPREGEAEREARQQHELGARQQHGLAHEQEREERDAAEEAPESEGGLGRNGLAQEQGRRPGDAGHRRGRAR